MLISFDSFSSGDDNFPQNRDDFTKARLGEVIERIFESGVELTLRQSVLSPSIRKYFDFENPEDSLRKYFDPSEPFDMEQQGLLEFALGDKDHAYFPVVKHIADGLHDAFVESGNSEMANWMTGLIGQPVNAQAFSEPALPLEIIESAPNESVA